MAEVVIRRPSWIWDSRAPFHNFLLEHKRINRQFGSVIVATEAACYSLRMPANEARAVRKTLHVDTGTARAGQAWMMFGRASAEQPNRRDPNRSPELFLNGAAEADAFVQQAAIVAYAAMFETYVLCWALNFLLALVESGTPLGTPALSLIETFANKPRHLNAPDAIRAFSTVWEGLATLPHVFTDRASGEAMEKPVDQQVNARNVIFFWRAYRNQVVHDGGLVTDSFAQCHGALWERLRQPYGLKLVPMRVGERLQVNDDVVRAAFTVHYRAARWMTEQLVNLSAGRRGHVLAPAAPQEDVILGADFMPQRLLLEGDHEPSLLAAAGGPDIPPCGTIKKPGQAMDRTR